MELPEATKVRLTTQHLVLKDLVSNLSEQEVSRDLLPGKWTIRQQIAHLVRYQDIFYDRVQIIMSDYNAIFTPYLADEDEKFYEITRLTTPQLLTDLNQKREIINTFYLGLNSGELSRKGRHTQLGYFSIALWAEFFLLHEAHHIYSVFLMSNQLSQSVSSDEHFS